MENLVAELKEIIDFKDSTDVGDIVLVAQKEPQMLLYGLVTNVERDKSRKAEWWHVELSFLSIPPQKTTWTLRTPQMTGMEIFTMGGVERFIKAVNFATMNSAPPRPPEPTKKQESFLKRVK